MALFDLTFVEKSEVESWLNVVRSSIIVKTNEKSAFYDFDFYQEKPVDRPKRFEWVRSESNVKMTERELSTRPSHGTVVMGNESEEIEDIPDFEILL